MQERRLSEIAQQLVKPSDIEGSDFMRIQKVALRAGVHFDLWQQGFLFLLFARNPERKYACGAGGAVLSSCRQIGKTFTVGTAMFIHAILAKGTKIIWTAHHTRTSDETFNDLCALERNPVLGRYVSRIRRANGQQEITFTNGSRIMFGARENGFGRGLHSVDVEIFDEAQILTQRALDNMVPVVNASPNPLVVFLGNPPKPGDQCEAFKEKRDSAIEGTDGMVYVELAADRDADSDDREQWAKANPSYPKRTSETSILRMRNLLAEDSFRREALGIWDADATQNAIDPDRWAKLSENDPSQEGLLAFGIDMPPSRDALAIGYAIKRDDGTTLIGIEEYRDARQHGTAWAADWLAERWHKTAAVVIDAQSPAMSLTEDLRRQHVRVTVTQTKDLGAATGRMLDMIHAGTIRHLPDEQSPQLAMAVKGANLRDLGPNGAVAWNKKGSDVDISPLQAVTLALHGAYTTKRRPGRKQKVMV